MLFAHYMLGYNMGVNVSALDGNSVCVDLTIECLTYSNNVVMPVGRLNSTFWRVEPELHAIEEVEAAPINDRGGASLFFGSEEDGSAEEPLEAFDKAAIVGAVFGKMKKVEHLGGRFEMKLAGFLPQCEGGDPDREEAILPERQAKIWMRDDVKKKFTVPPAMDHLGGRRAPQGKTA